MRFPFPVTVRVRRRAVDEWGDARVVAEFEIAGCALTARSGAALQRTSWSDVDDFRQDVVRRVRLLLPPGADLRPGDEVALPDDGWYRVDGEPTGPESPFTGWQPGRVAQLERVTG